MSEKIKIGILGYGNLGRGVELAVKKNDDLELVAIFTRRNPSKVMSKSKTLHISEIMQYKDSIDVMILCGGSAEDLPVYSPQIVKNFNIVDSYDNHRKILEHFKRVDEAAKRSGKIGLVSVGWDPGLFSINRLFGEAFLPKGRTYTFWGEGVSQGHSEAIRKIKGVKKGIQYTIPLKNAMNKVRKGENPNLLEREKHKRLCYVVAEEGEDLERIEREIKNMPNYFADYHTIVNFISEEEYEKNHKGMPHGGFVIRTGVTGESSKQTIEFNLKLESNPEFTANIVASYARAVYRMYKEGKEGAFTVVDIPLSYLLNKAKEELINKLL